MKMLKVEAVYLAERRTFEDAAADSPAFIDTIYNAARPHSAPGHPRPNQFEEKNAPERLKQTA